MRRAQLDAEALPDLDGYPEADVHGDQRSAHSDYDPTDIHAHPGVRRMQPDDCDARGDTYDPADDSEYTERFRFSIAHGHNGTYARPATFVAWTNEFASFQCPDCAARFSIEWLTWEI